MNTSTMSVYSTKLPIHHIGALRLLGIPIPKEAIRLPAVITFYTSGDSHRQSTFIQSRPWEGTDTIVWERAEPLEENEQEQLRLAFERPDLRPSDVTLAIAVSELLLRQAETDGRIKAGIEREGEHMRLLLLHGQEIDTLRQSVTDLAQSMMKADLRCDLDDISLRVKALTKEVGYLKGSATKRQKRRNEQSWFCEECKKGGTIQLKPHEDVDTVVGRLGDAHQDVSPKCGMGALGLIIEVKSRKWVQDAGPA